MQIQTSDSLLTEVLIAGDFAQISQFCREFASKNTICVVISPTNFIYNFGEESGASIRLINTPKNLKSNSEVMELAVQLARFLMDKCFQKSSVVLNSGKSILIERLDMEFYS